MRTIKIAAVTPGIDVINITCQVQDGDTVTTLPPLPLPTGLTNDQLRTQVKEALSHFQPALDACAAARALIGEEVKA